MGKEDILIKSAETLANGDEFVLATIISATSGSPGREGFKILYIGKDNFSGTVGGGKLEDTVLKTCEELLVEKSSLVKEFTLTEDKLGMACGGVVKVYFEYFNSIRKIFIFGGGHIGRALETILRLVGFETNVIDSREDVVNRSSFPKTKNLYIGSYKQLTHQMRPKENDCVVIATHQHKNDYEVLLGICQKKILPKYIGLIGSSKKLNKLFKQLKVDGIKNEIVERIFAPIGLNIAKSSAKEIAVAIAAEIIAVYNNVKKVDFLKIKKINNIGSKNE